MLFILALTPALVGPAAAQDATADATDTSSTSSVPGNPGAGATGPGGKLSFDERLVRGQVAAGSVYLFQRKPRALPGLVPVRRSYRAEILRPVLGERAAPQE